MHQTLIKYLSCNRLSKISERKFVNLVESSQDDLVTVKYLHAIKMLAINYI
jgi:hypothetical protein